MPCAVVVAVLWKDTLLDVTLDRRGVESGARMVGPLAYVATCIDVETLPTTPDRIDWRAPLVFAISALLHVIFVIGAWLAPGPDRRIVIDDLGYLRPVDRVAALKPAVLRPVSPPEPVSNENGHGETTASVLKGLKMNRRAEVADTATFEDLRTALRSPIFSRGSVDTVLAQATSDWTASERTGLAGLETRGSTIDDPSSVEIGSLPRLGPPGLTGPVGKKSIREPRITHCCCHIPRHRSDVRARLAKHRFRFLHCFERELGFDEPVMGKVVTRFTIDIEGHTKDVETVESTLGMESVERCVRRVISTIRFNPRSHDGEAEVRYPLIFESAG